MPPVPDSENINAINASLREICKLLDLKNSVPAILKCAEEIDQMAGQFNSGDLQILIDSGKDRWFRRYIHRSEHLNQIEKALAINK